MKINAEKIEILCMKILLELPLELLKKISS